jgi:hypothetical protein
MIALGVTACSNDKGPLPDADDLLGRSAEAMTAVAAAEFDMSVSGAPITISGLEMRSAAGVYAAPDSARATLTMRLGDVTLELVTISIAERTWLTEPLTGSWNELDPGTGFNPAVVFGDDGWAPLLAVDLVDATIAHHDRGYRVEGTAPAARVATLTSGLVRDQDVTITLVVDADTAHLLEARFTTVADGESTDWHIRLGPFDRPATIEAPTP